MAIVLIDDAGEPAVPVFQRTVQMSRHAGQMALPGGKVHEGEDAIACAIRELEEELGLAIRPESVIGMLDDFDTRSGFTITPVVAWSAAPASSLRPSSAEVAQLFVVGFGDLQAAAAGARLDSDFSLVLPQVEVFAPTAAILYQFSEVALAGRHVRVGGFFQPPFTHR